MTISRKSFHEYLTRGVCIIDGAMGTLIDDAGLMPEDYSGYEGCPEILNVSRPDLIESIHRQYLDAGAHIIETNTFGANTLVLKEHGLDDRTYELNLEGAKRARKAVDAMKDKRNFCLVAGSVGPGSRMPSLNHVSPDDIYIAYKPQILGLTDGGVDLLIIETAQDLLHVKTLVRLILDIAPDIPLIVSVTIESNGTMLAGSDIPAVVTALSPYPLSALGLNCATGPVGMRSHVRLMAELSPFPVFAMPNAGLPVHKKGRFVYELEPETMASEIEVFVRDMGASIVGGCCGSTPRHIRCISEKVGTGRKIPFRKISRETAVSSLYQNQAIRVKPAPLLIGERANANGSRAFRKALLREDWDAMMSIVNAQEQEGAHVVDVSLSVVGRDEKKDTVYFFRRLNTECRLPLQIDSTDPVVIETALKHCAGRCIVNSANLENGEETFLSMANLCKRYGAMLICLTIDEEGMAKTAERKSAIAGRMIALAEKAGLRREDLFIDTLTFTLGSGEDADRNTAVETLRAVKDIRDSFPEVHLLLGVSNVSFGLKPRIRHMLNSVMLYEAVRAGMHAAIIHPGKIMPLSDIPESLLALCRKLIYNDTTAGDPLIHLIQAGGENIPNVNFTTQVELTPEENLQKKLLHGDSAGLEKLLMVLKDKKSPLNIINDILLPGMKEIGELFGSGKMQLPFVLKSASVMKKAVDILKPFMDKNEKMIQGTIVLATVRGDVHDIGKNLVDVVLSNNGFIVHNIGIRQSPEAVLNAVQTIKPDALGLSGLLVRSTLEMKNTLMVLKEHHITIPVLLGGAALTESFVREELAPVYEGMVFYAADAFQGLSILNSLDEKIEAKNIRRDKDKGDKILYKKEGCRKAEISFYDYPSPPFDGVRIRQKIDIDSLVNYLNRKTLFTFQWQLRKGKMSREDYEAFLKQEGEERLREMLCRDEIRESFCPGVVYACCPVRKISEDVLSVHLPGSSESFQLTFPRQKAGECLSAADYYSPHQDGLMPIQCVTLGNEAVRYSRRLYASHDYAEYFFYHGLLMQLTEALAEENHALIRHELGLDKQKAEKHRKPGTFQGIRISPGYPMAPELESQKMILELLKASEIGVSLTSGYQLIPECSTTALILLHPKAKYFNI